MPKFLRKIQAALFQAREILQYHMLKNFEKIKTIRA